MTTKPIGELVLDVIGLRRQVQEHKATKDNLMAEWELVNAPLLAHLKQSQAELEVAESALRGVAVARYEMTKEKHPYPGVEVKVSLVPKYKDEDALAWGLLHPDLVMKFDRPAFEALAKSIPIHFVEKVEVAKCFLAADLGAVKEPSK